MCGRFTLTADPNELREAFPWLNIPQTAPPRYNIAPSQPVAVIPNDGKGQLDFYIWGLVPAWSKDISKAFINARAETLTEKPAFRTAFRYRRCLIPADGFYEWKQLPGQKGKTPFYIRLKSGQTFAFAGIWDRHETPDGSTLLTCAIITTQANELMQEIHNRMPVILPKQAYELWLDPKEPDIRRLQAVLRPFDAQEMTAYQVSTLVNNPENDLADCIVPA